MSSAIQKAAPWSERLPVPRRNNDEERLQKQVMQFLDLALPPDGIAYAVPNGGLRSKRVAERLKGTGLKAGIPDIAIVYRSRAFFIELKGPRGVQSPAQRQMANKLNYCGANVMLCRSVDDVEAMLRECCIPLRASVL